jgi:hypothetical protein
MAKFIRTLAVAMLAGSVARAVPITYTYTSVVETSNFDPARIRIGDVMTFTFTLDTETEPILTEPGATTYALTSATAKAGSVVWGNPYYGVLYVLNRSGFGGSDGYSFLAQNCIFALCEGAVSMFTSSDVITSDKIPTQLPDPADFDQISARMTTSIGRPFPTVEARGSSAQLVPEPGNLFCTAFVFSLSGLVLIRRHSNTARAN